MRRRFHSQASNAPARSPGSSAGQAPATRRVGLTARFILQSAAQILATSTRPPRERLVDAYLAELIYLRDEDIPEGHHYQVWDVQFACTGSQDPRTRDGVEVAIAALDDEELDLVVSKVISLLEVVAGEPIDLDDPQFDRTRERYRHWRQRERARARRR